MRSCFPRVTLSLLHWCYFPSLIPRSLLLDLLICVSASQFLPFDVSIHLSISIVHLSISIVHLNGVSFLLLLDLVLIQVFEFFH